MFQQRLVHVVCSTANFPEPMVTEEDSSDKATYSQDDIDDLAYSYVLTYGYEGTLAMLDELLASHAQDDVGYEDAVGALCRRILDAIHDEAATISRILDRMILPSLNGACHPKAAVACLGPNPIDQHIGHRLRQRRIELGLSLTKLAADLALTPQTLALIEEGATRLDAVTLERISVRLEVLASYFFRSTRPDENANVAVQ
jgi:DNA-binding XRE family transcriptional regulator